MEETNEFHKDHQTLVVVRAVADVMGDSNCTKRKWEKVDYIWLEETYGEFWIDNVKKELSQVKDPNELAERLTCILNVMLDAKWPIVTFKVKPQYAPYVTQKLRDLRKVKIRLWKEYTKTKNVETYKKMRTISNKLRNSTNRAAKRWFGRKMSDYKDSEKLWEFSKDCAGWKQDSTPSAVALMVSG